MAITLDGTTGITTPDLAVDTNSLFVDAANNRVGVVTSSPAAPLSVNGNGAAVRITGSGGDFHGLEIQCADASGSVTKHAYIDALNENGTSVANQLGGVQPDGGSFWAWATQSAGARTDRRVERMRIDSAGKLLAGTTSAFDTVSFLTFQSFGGVATKLSGTSPNSQMSFFNDNGRVGFIGTSGTTTSYNTSSDYRLKEDVQPMVGATDRVLALNPVNFAWKADGTRVDGFIAHEAQAVVPEAVTGEKDGEEMQAIDHSKLVPLLTAALQEALTEIADLKARVAALEA